MVNADEIYEAIAARFAPPEWAIFRELPDSVGFAVSRRADAVAFNCWPSRGLEIRGFEIKTNRSDLMREIKKVPEKAESVAQFCDTWCIVCPKELLDKLDLDVIPMAWGVIAYHPNTKTKLLRMVRDPLRNDSATPVDRPFLAAVLRKAHEYVEGVEGRYIRRSAIADKLKEEYERGLERAEPEKDRIIKKLKDRAAAANVFADALGVDLPDNWQKTEDIAKDAVEAMKWGEAVFGKFGHDARNIVAAGKGLIEYGERIKAVAEELEALRKNEEVPDE